MITYDIGLVCYSITENGKFQKMEGEQVHLSIRIIVKHRLFNNGLIADLF